MDQIEAMKSLAKMGLELQTKYGIWKIIQNDTVIFTANDLHEVEKFIDGACWALGIDKS